MFGVANTISPDKSKLKQLGRDGGCLGLQTPPSLDKSLSTQQRARYLIIKESKIGLNLLSNVKQYR